MGCGEKNEAQGGRFYNARRPALQIPSVHRKYALGRLFRCGWRQRNGSGLFDLQWLQQDSYFEITWTKNHQAGKYRGFSKSV